MVRIALKVEYHGAPFAGWQRQADQPSVQGAIEAALAKLEPGPHTIAAAGRTDAGVLALRSSYLPGPVTGAFWRYART